MSPMKKDSQSEREISKQLSRQSHLTSRISALIKSNLCKSS